MFEQAIGVNIWNASVWIKKYQMQYLKIVANYKSQWMKMITLLKILIVLRCKSYSRWLYHVWFILCLSWIKSTLSQ